MRGVFKSGLFRYGYSGVWICCLRSWYCNVCITCFKDSLGMRCIIFMSFMHYSIVVSNGDEAQQSITLLYDDVQTHFNQSHLIPTNKR